MQSLRSLAGKRLLAVDPGSRYIGLATRTCLLAGARPFGLLERTRPSGGGAPGQWTWTLRRTTHATGRPREVFGSQAAAEE